MQKNTDGKMLATYNFPKEMNRLEENVEPLIHHKWSV